MSLRYLIYTSELSDPAGAATVPYIIRTARTNNAIRGITGALIFDGERFCQYIEGAPDEIVRTFAAIEEDPRHTNLRVLASGVVDLPRFVRWSMAYVYAATADVIDAIGDRTVPGVAEAFTHALAQCDAQA